MTTTFDAYIIAIPHQHAAYIFADDQFGEGLVAQALSDLESQERLNDLSTHIVIESAEDEDRELATKTQSQWSVVHALIYEKRRERYEYPLTLDYRVVDAAEIVVCNGHVRTPNCSLADLIAGADYEPEVGEGLLNLPNHQAWPLFHPDVDNLLLGVVIEDPEKGMWFKNISM